MVRTISFAQAQSAYENMLPDDGPEPVDVQWKFDQMFFPGQLVMTHYGTGIITGNHEGEVEVDADEDGYYSVEFVSSVEVAIPYLGRESFHPSDIMVFKNGEWVDAD